MDFLVLRLKYDVILVFGNWKTRLSHTFRCTHMREFFTFTPIFTQDILFCGLD